MRLLTVRLLLALSTLVCASADAGPVSLRLSHVREHVEYVKDRLTTLCARDNAVPATVTLAVKARRSIELETVLVDRSTEPILAIKATTDDAFSQCFAQEASSGAQSRLALSPFSGTITVTLDRPDRILKRTIDNWLREEDTCRPRAGAIPTSMTIDITSDDVEMTVKLAVKPANATIEACELANLNALLLDARIDTGLWKPTAHIKHALTPTVSNARLRELTAFYAPQAAASCIPSDIAARVDEAIDDDKKPPRIGTMNVAVRATRDAPNFVVLARSGNKTRDACTAAALEKLLYEAFELRFEDDTTIFRIDGNAKASLRFPIETQRQLDARDEALRAKQMRLKP